METLLHTGELPEGKEKMSNFETFVDLIVVARIRRFTDRSESANEIADKWAKLSPKHSAVALTLKQTESLMLDYILKHECGIYYVYESRLDDVPGEFQSKKASRYLAAIELLTQYKSGKEKLSFAYDWLKANQQVDGIWDMGAAAKEGVYFPLSNRWDKATRITDSTHRISKLFSMPCYCGHDCAKCITYIATQTNDDNLRIRA